MQLKNNIFKNKKTLVIGLGVTGKSVIKFLKQQKAEIFFWDDAVSNFKDEKSLQHFNIKKDFEKKFDFLIVSPGVKKEHFLLKKFSNTSAKITNDIEIFWQIIKQNSRSNKIIGITGTNGKSTVASMIAHFFKTKVLGNFGNPVLDNISRHSKPIIIELSSFQLDFIKDFYPNISIITNLKRDHVSHHGSLRNYVNAKKKIFKNKTAEDVLVLNYDDQLVRKIAKSNIRAKIIWVSNQKELKNGISFLENKIIDNYFENKLITYNLNKKNNLLHNKINIIFSYSVLKTLGYKSETILRKLKTYKGLDYRLEYLGKIRQVGFYNDSKATNVAATCSAIESFDKVFLIAGGSDKKDDFKPLKKLYKKIYATYLYGETATKIATSLKNTVSSHLCNDLDEAIRKSFLKSVQTKKCYPILFSPACASFDQYENYKSRGAHFTKLFKVLSKEFSDGV